MKTIYYLEDDWRYAKAVISELKEKAAKSHFEWEIKRIPTESEFIAIFEKIKSGTLPRPDAFILDIMVRYATPNSNDKMDEETSMPPYDRAGIRCAELINRDDPHRPIILFTILDEEDLPPEVRQIKKITYLAKEPNMDVLFKSLCAALE